MVKAYMNIAIFDMEGNPFHAVWFISMIPMGQLKCTFYNLPFSSNTKRSGHFNLVAVSSETDRSFTLK